MLINFNHLKTFYNALTQKIKSFRGNWNQNDPSADDYIKNRPFYSEGVREVKVFPSRTLELDADYNTDILSSAFIEGQIYRVTWNNVEYECRAKNTGEGGIYIGNQAIVGWEFPESITSNEPFFMYTYQENGFLDSCIYPSKYGIYTISITALQEVVHKLDKKFVDMPDGIITEDSIYPILENNLAPVAFTNNYNSLSGKPNAIQYAPQDLTDDQKAQARANIGAGTGDYNDLINVPRVNFWENDSDNVTSIPGVIRQESLPDGYPYVTYTAGELVNSLMTGTLTVTKTDNGVFMGKINRIFSGGIDKFTNGAKYLLVIGDKTYPLTCSRTMPDSSNSNNVFVDGTTLSIFINTNGTITPYPFNWAQLIRAEGTYEYGIYNAIPTYQPIAEKYLPNNPKQYLSFTDTETSYKYYVRITNGTLTTMCACAYIYVKDLSDRTFVRGEPLDLTDMIIAVCEDGSERIVNNCIYPPVVPSINSPIVTITYIEDGISFTTDINLKINISEQDLVDFEYVAQEDGTYMLTGWKGTLNGETSTECVIPNSNQIII